MVQSGFLVWLLIVGHPTGPVVEYRAPSRDICEYVAQKKYPKKTHKGQCIQAMGSLATV
jgi:hypothetical protein